MSPSNIDISACQCNHTHNLEGHLHCSDRPAERRAPLLPPKSVCRCSTGRPLLTSRSPCFFLPLSHLLPKWDKGEGEIKAEMRCPLQDMPTEVYRSTPPWWWWWWWWCPPSISCINLIFLDHQKHLNEAKSFIVHFAAAR